jgi:very-short-patch-repair endonuclease
MTVSNEVDKLPPALSELEETFVLQLLEAGISDYEREYKFDENRDWRIDFYFRKAALFVEWNGGTWMKKSGHNTAKGIQRDYEKSNAAQLAGFTYLQFTEKELDNRVAIETVKKLLESK